MLGSDMSFKIINLLKKIGKLQKKVNKRKKHLNSFNCSDYQMAMDNEINSLYMQMDKLAGELMDKRNENIYHKFYCG